MYKRCEFIEGVHISYDDERRMVVIDGHVLRFGCNQYTILRLLLEQQEVGDDAFSLALYGRDIDEDHRKLMTKDISRLRERLRMYELGIRRVHDQGYRLVRLVAMTA